MFGIRSARIIFLVLVVISGLAVGVGWAAEPAQPLATAHLQLFVSGLVAPLDFQSARDGTGRFFIVEQGGTIRIVKGQKLLATPFLNISSIIVSGVTVHDAIRARAPDLLEPLYRGYHYHRLGEEGPGEEPATPYRTPVFANRNGQLSCRYQRSGIAAGQRERGVPLDERDLEALNLFDQVAAAPENRLAFFLERGDMIVINNYTVMHARTRFTNFPEPERQRRLVRMWFDSEDFRDVPREFNLFAENGIPKQEGRRATFDFKKLYRDDPAATGGVPDLKISDGDAARAR